MNNHAFNRRGSAGLALLVLIMSYGFALPDAQVADRISSEYRIGAKDVLEVKFYGQEKMDQTVRVSEEGTITMPLVGVVDVNGLTAAEVERMLRKLYIEGLYFKDPQISVFIREFQSKRVSILGAVEKPGPYELIGQQTLLWLIAEAGGLSKDAGPEIFVIRLLSDGTSRRLTVPIVDLISKGDPQVNFVLEPGDNIVVPEDTEIVIYVYGQVGTPGAFRVLRSRTPSLVQLIAQAGGFTERAARKRVLIRRRDEKGVEKTITINVKDIERGKRKDFLLQENDTIFVPETWF